MRTGLSTYRLLQVNLLAAFSREKRYTEPPSESSENLSNICQAVALQFRGTTLRGSGGGGLYPVLPKRLDHAAFLSCQSTVQDKGIYFTTGVHDRYLAVLVGLRGNECAVRLWGQFG
jgi:hypothetical protein